MFGVEMIRDIDVVHVFFALWTFHGTVQVKKFGMLGLIFVITRFGFVQSQTYFTFDGEALFGPFGVRGTPRG